MRPRGPDSPPVAFKVSPNIGGPVEANHKRSAGLVATARGNEKSKQGKRGAAEERGGSFYCADKAALMSELLTIRVAAARHILGARRTGKLANEGLHDGMLSHPRPPPPVEPCRGPRSWARYTSVADARDGRLPTRSDRFSACSCSSSVRPRRSLFPLEGGLTAAAAGLRALNGDCIACLGIDGGRTGCCASNLPAGTFGPLPTTSPGFD